MTDFGITLPLRIEVVEEAVKVIDNAGIVISYTYFADDPDRRFQTHRLSREQAVEVAKVIAREVTDRVGR